jgi:hypothetical protein
MKWFFLIVLGLFGVSVNLLLVADNLYTHIPALVALNVTLVGLMLIWHTVYFQSNVIGAKGKDLGIALLCFSIGIFTIIGGTEALLTSSCENFLSRRPYRLRNDIVRFIESVGYCKELGYAVVVMGSSIAFIGARLVLRLTRRGYL